MKKKTQMLTDNELFVLLFFSYHKLFSVCNAMSVITKQITSTADGATVALVSKLQLQLFNSFKCTKNYFAQFHLQRQFSFKKTLFNRAKRKNWFYGLRWEITRILSVCVDAVWCKACKLSIQNRTFAFQGFLPLD